MRIRTLDLFCGAGGSSWGAAKAGAEIVMGVDSWEQAITTYGQNFDMRGEAFLMKPRTDPSELGLRKGQIDLLLASPECTHHTCAKGAGERSEESKRTAHYVLTFARKLEPRWVVIENVIHMKGWQGYAPLLKGLQSLGYNCREEVIDSVEFGVPQTRKRLFILCDRERMPDPLPRKRGGQKPASSILDFDPVTGQDKWESRPLYCDGRAKPTIERFERGLEALGEDVPFLIVYYGSDGSGGWQPLNRPLRTITTLDRFGLVTWRNGEPYLRMLQVPELARAMGFKRGERFQLTGSRRDQIKQLGNGVCPPVMQAIVEHLASENPKHNEHPKPKKRPKPKKMARLSGIIS